MRLRNAIAALDRAAMRRVAQNDSRLLDLVMPRLSRAANHGMLWTGLAIGLWLTGDRWARRPPVPAAAVRPPRDAPAAPAGEGLVLAVNASAGTASSGLARQLRAELPRAVIIETHAGQDLAGQLRLSAGRARVLGVAGGDGTVSTACAVALEAGLPLLVVPAGTFKHFPADLGVWSVEDALAALRAGEAVLGEGGVAGRRAFINTSSTGGFGHLVGARGG